MKLVKYIDIQDEDVTAAAYTLFFAFVELQGNDLVYKQYTECWNMEDSEPTERAEQIYRKQLARGWRNCFHNEQQMKDFVENPPTLKEAYKQVWTWLKEQGINEDDEWFLVKVWW